MAIGSGGSCGKCCVKTKGFIITCEIQTLGESFDITGTSFSLNYQSDRTPGYIASKTLNIPISGASVPTSLKRIDLEIYVAGRRFNQTFSAAPNQNYTFTWDGKDAYGRTVQGSHDIIIRIGYVYPAVYYPARVDFVRSFAMASSGAGTAISLATGKVLRSPSGRSKKLILEISGMQRLRRWEHGQLIFIMPTTLLAGRSFWAMADAATLRI